MTAMLVAALLAQAYYTPAEAQAVFGQANDAYYREAHDEAIERYQALLTHGYGGPDVEYNLGTVYLAEGDVGRAVLHLERARREGGGEDVEAQLAQARARQLDQVVGAQVHDPFVSRVVAATDGRLAGWLFLFAWAAAFAALTTFRLLAPGRRAWAAVAASISLTAALPAGAVLAAHVYQREVVSEAVVLARSAKVRELPREAAKVAFEVHAGLKVRTLEDAGPFVRIRLPNGLEGWTDQAALGAL